MPLGYWSYFEIARATVTSGGLRSFQINRFALATSVQQPPSMSGKSRGLGLAVLAMIVAFDLAGCDSKNAYVPPPPSKVIVARPVQKPVTLYLNLTGNTAPFAPSIWSRASKAIWNRSTIRMAPRSRKERSSSVSSATSIRRNSIKPKGNWRTTRRCSKKRK